MFNIQMYKQLFLNAMEAFAYLKIVFVSLFTLIYSAICRGHISEAYDIVRLTTLILYVGY